jgi:hypothetical protein
MRERIDGLSYNLGHESVETLQQIHGHLIESHRKILVDIERIEHEIATRNQPEIQFPSSDNYERALGHAILEGEISASEALMALEQFERGRTGTSE